MLRGLKPSFSTFIRVNTIQGKADALENKLRILRDFTRNLFSKYLERIAKRLNGVHTSHWALHAIAQKHTNTTRYLHGKCHGIVNIDIKIKR